jgi:Carboxypeptidase regulatory-like domain/TonB dependent receptor-like, beta-barrel/TonB-dependent Receptor Plug Domain
MKFVATAPGLVWPAIIVLTLIIRKAKREEAYMHFAKIVLVPVVLALALNLLIVVPAYSQAGSGTIRGTATDQSGAVIPNTQVVIKNVATGVTRAVSTNQSGSYSAPNLVPGTYEIRASAPGFTTEVRSGITLTVGSEQVIDLRLQVGAVAETVEVTGAAPAVDLATAAVSSVVNETTIRELPLNGRDWTQLATLQPGVSITRSQWGADAMRAPRGFGVDLAVSGGRPSQNNFLLNGISINDYGNATPGSALGVNLGVDAIQEFSVLTSTYSAEYGKSSAGVVNAITKSGTNAFHGSAYYFVRNSVLDAAKWEDNAFGTGKPPFKRNQFGGSLGGPIKKDRTFWFADFEGLRQSLGVTQASIVPSAAARNGQLSTGTVTVDPKVKPYLPLFPLPNGSLLPGGDVGNFAFAAQQISREDYVTGRLDHRLSDADNIFGSYLYDRGDVLDPDEFNDKPFTTPNRHHTATIEEEHIFGPRVVNSLRFGLNRVYAADGVVTQVYNPLLNDPSLGFLPGNPVGTLEIGSGVTGFSGGFGPQNSDVFYFTTLQGYDDVSINRGDHSIKLGVGVERERYNYNNTSSNSGDFSFNSLSDFLTNVPFQAQAAFPGTDTYRGIRQTISSAYVQDDWRLRPNLTLNLGLRYEFASNISEVNGKLAALRSPSDPLPAIGPYFLNNPTSKDFQPRVGFAWDPFGTGKTSVRGGFGMFTLLPLPAVFSQDVARSNPFYAAGVLNQVPPGTFPVLPLSLLASQLRTVYEEPRPSRSYMMQWNLNIQRDLGRNYTATIGFVGSRGVHLPWKINNFNTVLPTLTDQGYVYPKSGSRINSVYGAIRGKTFNADSFYDSLQLGLKKGLSHGLQLQAAYTWSKSIDTSSVEFTSNEFSNSTNIPVPFDPRVNRGPSDFNLTHNFSGNFLWTIPSPAAWKGVQEFLASGWQFGGILTASSGTPFSVGITGDRAGSKMGSDSAQRPVRVSSPECSTLTNAGNPNHYIKTQCFTFPAANIIYNIVGRNALTGPGFMTLDFSLFKNHSVARISENFKVQFRAEFFNMLNRPNFAAPNDKRTIFDGSGNLIPSAGLIDSTVPPARQIQFGLKFIW